MSETIQKQSYKQTEVGLIPVDWERIRVDKVITVARGGSPRPIQDFVSLSSNGLNWIKIGDTSSKSKYIVSSKEKIKPEGAQFSREVNVGDFILSNSMSFGRPYILKIDGCIHDGWLVLQNYQDAFDREFLYYTLMSKDVYNQYIMKASGSSVLNLNKEIVKTVELNRPTDIEEQNAIATALSDMDELLTSLEQLISKKQAIKQGAMQELLTPPHKGGKRLPGFSGEWEEKKLGDLALINMGQSPLSGNYNLSGNGLPLVQGNADIQKRKTIVRNYTSQITKTANRGDIIMSVRAPVGEIATASFKCCIGRGVCSIKYQNDFLYYYLIYIEHSWSKFSTGSTFDSINSNQLRGINVSLPESLKEQKAIAQVLSDMDEEIKVLEEKKDKYQKIKGGMMQELLTGKIRLV